MTKLIGLKENYIQVQREGSSIITYGGDQGFFKGAPSGSEDEKKQKMGCGFTAFADLLLYLSGNRKGYQIPENDSYVNRIMTQKEYKEYYDKVYSFMGKIRNGAKNGLSAARLQSRFNRMAKQQCWRLRARWGLSARKLFGRIEEMLLNDLPVILCIPMLFGKKNRDQGISFYRKEAGEYRKACMVSAHFVVVTGMIWENEEIWLRISSWGVEYYVNWKEYDRLIHAHFLGTILGNILYIRSV